MCTSVSDVQTDRYCSAGAARMPNLKCKNFYESPSMHVSPACRVSTATTRQRRVLQQAACAIGWIVVTGVIISSFAAAAVPHLTSWAVSPDMALVSGFHHSVAVSPFRLAVAISVHCRCRCCRYTVCVGSSASMIGWPATERKNGKIELDPISTEERLRNGRNQALRLLPSVGGSEPVFFVDGAWTFPVCSN